MPSPKPAKVTAFPDLAPKTRNQILGGELGTQWNYQDRLFAMSPDGDILDYGEVTARDFETMLRRDGTAASLESVLTLPLRQADYTIQPAKHDNGEAEFARSVLMTPHTGGGMATPLSEVIGQMTAAQIYRKAYFELKYDIRDSDGRIVLDKIAYRPPSTCEQKRDPKTAAPDGFRQNVWLWGVEGNTSKQKIPGYVEIPQTRSFVYVHGKHRNPLAGTSELELTHWALAHGSEVQTPNGPVAIEDLSPGDLVFGANGESTAVTEVFDRGVQPMFRVRLDDQTSVLCSGDHLWTVEERQTNGTTRTVTVSTSHMLAKGVRMYDGFRFLVPVCKEVQYPERELVLDPYVLGAWLGDGGIQKTAYGPQSPAFTCHDKDIEIIREVETRLPPGIVLIRRDALHHGVVDTLRLQQNRFKDALVTLGVAVRGPEKFIPQIYLTASPKQRWDMLRGLMDTDGCARSGKRSLFTTTSERLAKDVQRLVQSLGGKACLTGPIFSDGGILNGHAIIRRHGIYRVYMTTPQPAFRLQRKADRWDGGDACRRKNDFKSVVSIKPEGQKECRCIAVANEDGLFLTDNYTVTHNCYKTKLKLLFLLPSFGISSLRRSPSPRSSSTARTSGRQTTAPTTSPPCAPQASPGSSATRRA